MNKTKTKIKTKIKTKKKKKNKKERERKERKEREKEKRKKKKRKGISSGANYLHRITQAVIPVKFSSSSLNQKKKTKQKKTKQKKNFKKKKKTNSVMHKSSNKGITSSSLSVGGAINMVNNVKGIREKSKRVVQPPWGERE